MGGISQIKKSLAIGSGKGGVGKSTLTVNLARAFYMLGWKVGVLDADIYGPSIDVMMPIDQGPRVEGETIIPALSKGIKVATIAHFPSFHGANAFRAPIANAIIEQFLHKIDWGELDLLLIDLPPGTGDIHLTLMQTIALTGSLAITTPQKIATHDVEKAIEMFKKLHVPLLGIVENMSYYEDLFTREKIALFGQGGGKLLAEKYRVPLLPSIPLDPVIGEAMDQGEIFLEEERETKRVFFEIAIELSKQICDDHLRRAIGEVRQEGPYQVEIFFGDERKRFFAKEIQQRCRCALCQRMQPRPVSEEEVGIKGVKRLGNYAIQFLFTSGCSRGIYTWEQLA